MKLRRPIITVAALAAAAVTASAGPAAPASAGRSCSGEVDVTATPGLSSQPSSGYLHTGGETGKMTCGSQSGPLGFDGRYGTKDPDTCAGGEGWVVGTWAPSGGPTVRDAMTYEYGKIDDKGVFTGTIEGEHWDGSFTSTPVEGDCVTRPATRFHVRIAWVER